MVPYGACQDLVRRRDVGRDLGNMIDDDGALLHLHPCGQMMLSALQRFRRHRRSAARHGHGDILVRHPQRGERATHAVEAGLQDLRKFVRVARRGLIGGDLHHQFQVALFDVQIALAGTQLGAQRQLAAQAFECRLHQLTDGLQRARLDLGSGQPHHQAYDRPAVQCARRARRRNRPPGRRRWFWQCPETRWCLTGRWRSRR